MSDQNFSTDYIDYTTHIDGVANRFTFYFFLIVTPLGLVCNLISIYIYKCPSLNKNTNIGILYVWLCLLNMISLCYFTCVTQSSALFNYTVPLPCGLEVFFRRMTFNSISWMQVLISFDRFIAVMYPKSVFMKKKVCSKFSSFSQH